jgi:hypothetical protein
MTDDTDFTPDELRLLLEVLARGPAYAYADDTGLPRSELEAMHAEVTAKLADAYRLALQ